MLSELCVNLIEFLKTVSTNTLIIIGVITLYCMWDMKEFIFEVFIGAIILISIGIYLK